MKTTAWFGSCPKNINFQNGPKNIFKWQTNSPLHWNIRLTKHLTNHFYSTKQHQNHFLAFTGNMLQNIFFIKEKKIISKKTTTYKKNEVAEQTMSSKTTRTSTAVRLSGRWSKKNMNITAKQVKSNSNFEIVKDSHVYYWENLSTPVGATHGIL